MYIIPHSDFLHRPSCEASYFPAWPKKRWPIHRFPLAFSLLMHSSKCSQTNGIHSSPVLDEPARTLFCAPISLFILHRKLMKSGLVSILSYGPVGDFRLASCH